MGRRVESPVVGPRDRNSGGWTEGSELRWLDRGVDVNTDPNIECRISKLEYADDVALFNAATADANIRLESLSRGKHGNMSRQNETNAHPLVG